MHEIVARLRTSQPFRYICIGGVSYVIELSALLLLVNVLLVSSELAVACSFWIGLVVSFLLQKYLAFGNKTREKRVLGKQAFLYGVLILVNYVFTIAFVGVFVSLLGLILSRTIALLLTVTWNYFVYRYIFK